MLEGIIRESIDKRSTKSLRKDGYLIANIYAKGIKNINAAFKVNEFIKAVKSKSDLKFPVKVDGKTYNVVVVDYQKHPVTSALKHVDLKIVLDDEISKYMIPVKLSGSPIGLKNKGILLQSKKRLAIKCKGKYLPNSFDIDVSNLDLEDAILIRDMKFPENIRVLDADRIAVVGVVKAK